MIRKIASLAVAGIAALSMAGCATGDSYSQASTPSLAAPPRHVSRRDDAASLVYLAAQTLADRAEGLDKTRPIVVATVVSVDDMKSSSTFGRLASEWIANRVEQRGYLVRDVTYTGALTVNRAGTLVLSRDALALSRQIGAQAVVAGTYAVAGERIYLSLRLLSARSGELISSTDVAIPLDDDTRPLVEATSAPMALSTFEARATR
ncbi:MAG: FlgO family outer membrane protein [Rhizomicrobium sp.]|jgi:TolB-like protein